MIFNFTNDWKFNTRLSIENQKIEQIKETKLLGVWITDDLKWSKNTSEIVRNSYARMSIIRKLKAFQVPTDDLINIYILYIRSRLEQSAVVWHSSLTHGEVKELERVQKVALRLILGDYYINYDHARLVTAIQTLSERRTQLCTKFAKKSIKNETFKDLFQLNTNSHHEKFHVTFAKTDRLKNSAIPFMQRLLNTK